MRPLPAGGGVAYHVRPPDRPVIPEPAADVTTTLIPGSAERPGDDPIFALHAEAVRRAAAGESVLDATLGALMQDDGRLAILPVVSEAIRRVDPERAAAYAPISGPPAYLAAVAVSYTHLTLPTKA